MKKVEEFVAIAVDLITLDCAKTRDPTDTARIMDRDDAVRRLLRAGANPELLDLHISTPVRVELEMGKLT